MIKNERQYRVTKSQALRFSDALETLRQTPKESNHLHPVLVKAQEEALSSQIADLQSELEEYESLKRGEFQLDSLKLIANMPAILIKARIAQGLSQRELAARTGLKEQQIQRYEATDYASASLSRLREIANAIEAQ